MILIYKGFYNQKTPNYVVVYPTFCIGHCRLTHSLRVVIATMPFERLQTFGATVSIGVANTVLSGFRLFDRCYI